MSDRTDVTGFTPVTARGPAQNVALHDLAILPHSS